MPPPSNGTRPSKIIATVLADSFLTLHYSLADLDGDEYVSTFGLSPATLQMGSGQLAETLGRSGAARAVGAANGSNPISIVVPCHRVVGADGSLTGYAGGLVVKEFLLRLESAR